MVSSIEAFLSFGRRLISHETEAGAEIKEQHSKAPRRAKQRTELARNYYRCGRGKLAFDVEQKLPGIEEDGRCGCKLGNQTVEHVLLNCRLYNKERQGSWAEESRKAPQEGGRSRDIELFITPHEKWQPKNLALCCAS